MGRPSTKGRLVFTGFLMAVNVLFILTAFGYEPKARMIPLIVGIATLAVGVLVLVNELHPLRFVARLDLGLMEAPEGGGRKKDEEQTARGRLLNLTGWILGFFVLIFLVGFHIAILAFAAAYLKLQGKAGWLQTIVGAVCVWGAIYLMFEVAMGFGLYKGVLLGEMMPYL